MVNTLIDAKAVPWSMGGAKRRVGTDKSRCCFWSQSLCQNLKHGYRSWLMILVPTWTILDCFVEHLQ